MKVKITCHNWITRSLADYLTGIGMTVHGLPIVDPVGDGMDILYVSLTNGWSVKMLNNRLVTGCDIPKTMFSITELF